LAECERELLAERTPLEPARTRGKPRKMTAAQLLIAQAAMQKPETKVSGLCAELDISAQTLYRYLDPLGELRPRGLRLLGERAKPPHNRELVVEHTRVGPAQPRRALGRSHKITAAQLRGAQAAMRKPETNVADLCAKLGISRQTMYRYLDPLGELRPNGLRLLGERGISPHKRELVVERTRVGPPPPRARSIPRKMTAAQLLIAQAAMGKPGTKVSGLCAELGISAQTLYRHVDPRGELRPAGIRLLGRRGPRPRKPPAE
jgi:DNA-binding MarR family transcriptional regulator